MMRRLGGLSTEQQIDRVYENMRPSYRRYIHRSGITGVADLIYRVTEHEDIELPEAEYNEIPNDAKIGRRWHRESRESDKRERDDKPDIPKKRVLLELRPGRSPENRL